MKFRTNWQIGKIYKGRAGYKDYYWKVKERPVFGSIYCEVMKTGENNNFAVGRTISVALHHISKDEVI